MIGASAALAMVSLAMSACSSQTHGSGGSGSGSSAPYTATIRLTGTWSTLDPQNPTVNPGNQAWAIIGSLYDSLLAIGPTGKLVPYLATSWTQTPTTITFKIRKGATCSDGTKITPTVVKESWAKTLKAQGESAHLGPGPYSLAADNAADTFTFTSKTPFSDAIDAFAGAQGAVVCPAGLKDPNALNTKPAGSGPYTLESLQPGVSATLKLRPDWTWGPDGITAKSGLPTTVVYKIVANDTTAANLLLTGGLNLTLVNGPDVKRLLANKSLTHKVAIGPQTVPMTYNESQGRPTASLAVRQALGAAINRSSWNQIVYDGQAATSPSFLGPTADCYSSSTASLLPANPGPAQAKKILSAAGWKLVNGKFEKNGKPLVINYWAPQSVYGNGPDYIDAQWLASGITVKYHLVDFNSYLQALLAGVPDAVMQGNSAITPNPNAGVTYFLGTPPPAGSNFPHINDPQAEAQLLQAEGSVGAARCQHWTDVVKDMLQNSDFTPLAAPSVEWFSQGLQFVPGTVSADVRYIRKTSGA